MGSIASDKDIFLLFSRFLEIESIFKVILEGVNIVCFFNKSFY